MKDYKISVLTPSYNSAKYLERAIESVLKQDYTNWEHIVMDGGSEDGTKEILAKYSHLNWVSEPDKGQSDAMNKAFAKSTGDIIVYLNADDYFYPNVFQYVIQCFENNPNADMIVGNLEMIFSNGYSLIHNPSIQLDDVLVYNDPQFPLNPVSYFYKRKIQEEIGSFPIDNHYTMDYWFILRVLKKFTLQKEATIFGVFVQDGNNKSSKYLESQYSLYNVWSEFILCLDSSKVKAVSDRLFYNFAKQHQDYKELEYYYQLKDTEVSLNIQEKNVLIASNDELSIHLNKTQDSLNKTQDSLNKTQDSLHLIENSRLHRLGEKLRKLKRNLNF